MARRARQPRLRRRDIGERGPAVALATGAEEEVGQLTPAILRQARDNMLAAAGRPEPRVEYPPFPDLIFRDTPRRPEEVAGLGQTMQLTREELRQRFPGTEALLPADAVGATVYPGGEVIAVDGRDTDPIRWTLRNTDAWGREPVPVPRAPQVQLTPEALAIKLDEDCTYLLVVSHESGIQPEQLNLAHIGIDGIIVYVYGDPAKAMRAYKLRGKHD